MERYFFCFLVQNGKLNVMDWDVMERFFAKLLREGVPVVSGLAVVPMDVYDHIVVNIPGFLGILWGHFRFQEFDGPFSPW